MFTINYYELMFSVHCSSVYVYSRCNCKKKNNEMAANSFCGHFISKNIELELQNDYRHGKYWAFFLIFTF